jgi:uncharacterized MAPEG superfamily protein
MTPELAYLLAATVLTFALLLIAVSGATLQVGLPTLAGNREPMPEVTGWAGRARRAHYNMLESLVLFAILVLTARAVGVSNAKTVLGAELFFWGRIAHAVFYLVGIAWLRTAAWGVSVLGLILLFVALIQ